MLTIHMSDNRIYSWQENEYTDYKFVNNFEFFIVIKDEQWVGMYNVPEVSCIEYRGEKVR